MKSMALRLVVGVASLGAAACARKEPSPAPPPEVLVTPVVQKDVPVVSEWIRRDWEV